MRFSAGNYTLLLPSICARSGFLDGSLHDILNAFVHLILELAHALLDEPILLGASETYFNGSDLWVEVEQLLPL